MLRQRSRAETAFSHSYQSVFSARSTWVHDCKKIRGCREGQCGGGCEKEGSVVVVVVADQETKHTQAPVRRALSSTSTTTTSSVCLPPARVYNRTCQGTPWIYCTLVTLKSIRIDALGRKMASRTITWYQYRELQNIKSETRDEQMEGYMQCVCAWG